MAELLASLKDINRWLPSDKVVANDTNTAEFQVEALQLVRGQLASSFTPTILTAWTNPAATPKTIRSIASRLIAAYLYRKVYSEESTKLPEYAQQLYNEAVQMLADIRANKLIVLDDDDIPIGTNESAMSSADFFPNDSASGPFFTMDAKFG